MVWYGMVWYGNRIIFIAKILKTHRLKYSHSPPMQRFSKKSRKNQRCKGSQKATQKPKMQRFSKSHAKTKDAKVLKKHNKKD
jgi:hypothetical protein